MLKIISGITITPPVIGRITLGHVELRRDGEKTKAIPQKDDHLSITTLVQEADRVWETHPIQEKYTKANEKLTSIPVRVIYNDPQLTLQNSFSCFSQDKGRVMCSGDGTRARRVTDVGVQEIACERPEACEFAKKYHCKNMTRIYLQIEGQEDDLGVFVLRTTSYNTLNAVASRLLSWYGLTNGNMAGLPLALKIVAKSTIQSYRQPIYYVDLVLRSGMDRFSAIRAAREYQKSLQEAELNQGLMEQQLLAGLKNSDFVADIEDPDEWVTSDDDLAAAADVSLRNEGLRGLDELVAATAGPQAEVSATQTEPPPLVLTTSAVPEVVTAPVPEGAGGPAPCPTETATVEEELTLFPLEPVQCSAPPPPPPEEEQEHDFPVGIDDKQLLLT